MSRRLLAASTNYRIESEYEVVFLVTRNREIVIGDFYGDPEAALIDHDERWCMMAGCGIIVYYLRKPWQPYVYALVSEQWHELFRDPKDIWWIVSLEQISQDRVRFERSESIERPARSFVLHVPTFAIETGVT